MSGLPVAALPLLAFPVLLVVAALKDTSSYTIPNWIPAAMLALFFPAALTVQLHWGLVAQHAAVGGAALLLGVGMFSLKWIGGGDAKLFSASALWLGLSGAPAYLFWTAVAGGVLTLGLIAVRRVYALSPAPFGPNWLQALLHPKGDVPYGVAMAVGALLAFPQSGLFGPAA